MSTECIVSNAQLKLSIVVMTAQTALKDKNNNDNKINSAIAHRSAQPPPKNSRGELA